MRLSTWSWGRTSSVGAFRWCVAGPILGPCSNTGTIGKTSKKKSKVGQKIPNLLAIFKWTYVTIWNTDTAKTQLKHSNTVLSVLFWFNIFKRVVLRSVSRNTYKISYPLLPQFWNWSPSDPPPLPNGPHQVSKPGQRRSQQLWTDNCVSFSETD